MTTRSLRFFFAVSFFGQRGYASRILFFSSAGSEGLAGPRDTSAYVLPPFGRRSSSPSRARSLCRLQLLVTRTPCHLPLEVTHAHTRASRRDPKIRSGPVIIPGVSKFRYDRVKRLIPSIGFHCDAFPVGAEPGVANRQEHCKHYRGKFRAQ